MQGVTFFAVGLGAHALAVVHSASAGVQVVLSCVGCGCGRAVGLAGPLAFDKWIVSILLLVADVAREAFGG